MAEDLPTLRLSPKNQVTLPRLARGLRGAESDGYLCATRHRLRRPEDGSVFQVVVLMTEGEVEARENAIRNSPDLDPAAKEARVARLNGHVVRLPIDGQRRVVLPKHLVEYLGLEREVYMVSTNTTVLVWQPDDWRRWSRADEEDEADDDDGFMMI